jgi:hypothetical protein
MFALTRFEHGAETVVRRFDSLDDVEAIREWGAGILSLRRLASADETLPVSREEYRAADRRWQELKRAARAAA